MWNGTVSAKFRSNRPKFCVNCTFSQNLQVRKLGKIAVFLRQYVSQLFLTVFQKVEGILSDGTKYSRMDQVKFVEGSL